MKPYSLTEAQSLVSEAIDRSQKRHLFWRNLEYMFHTGSYGGLTSEAVSGTLFDTLTNDDLETVNLVLPRIKLMIARLTARDPRPVAQALSGTEQSEVQERLVEAVLEYFFNRTSGVATVRDLAQDLIVCGNAFAKVMWSFDEEERELSDDDFQTNLLMAIELERQAAILDGREMVSLEELEGSLPSTYSTVVEDEPFVGYVRPYDIFLPASARRLEDARWVAQRIIMPLDEAREKYPNSDLTASALSSELFLHDDIVRNKDDEDLVELFEFYDQATRTLMVFADDSDKPCFEGDWPYAHRHFPFVHLAGHRARPSDFWAFGDLQQLTGLQHRFNEVWTRIVDSTFRAGRKYLAVKGALDEEAVSALESEDDDVVVFVDGPAGENPANLISPLFRQPISGEVLNTQGQLVGLMDQVLAMNEFDMGGSGADRMSATAAAAVMGVAEQRAADKQLLLEEACSKIYSLMLLLCQEFMTAETAVKIAGPNGAVWPTVTGEDIQGEYRLRVETGSMNGETRAMRRAEGSQLLSQVVPALAGLGYDVDGVVRSAMKRMGYDPDELGLRKTAPEAPAGLPAAGGPMTTSAQMEGLTGIPMPTDAQEGGDIVV